MMNKFPAKLLPYVISAIILPAFSVLATPAFAFVEPAPMTGSVVQMIGCDVGVYNGSSKPVVVCTNRRFKVNDNWN